MERAQHGSRDIAKAVGGTHFVIRPLATRADYDACTALQEITWGAGFNERVPPGVLRLSQRLGGIASGAFDPDGSLLGFVFGMTGLYDSRVSHWSDMLAVRPDARDRGIGEALKWHQRERLLEVGVTLAQWTFDPLEARNAWLNFARLGCTSSEYVRNFYDASDSPLHLGLATDRLIVSWDLDSDRVARRHRNGVPPSSEAMRSAPLVNASRLVRGHLDIGSVHTDPDASVLRVAIPTDIQKLKREAPELALEWQQSVREAFEFYFARGYTATELLRGDVERSYVIQRSG
ncbi:MAG: hypothetical protein ACREL7_03765 [Longimicrobiales bacterium]